MLVCTSLGELHVSFVYTTGAVCTGHVQRLRDAVVDSVLMMLTEHAAVAALVAFVSFAVFTLVALAAPPTVDSDGCDTLPDRCAPPLLASRSSACSSSPSLVIDNSLCSMLWSALCRKPVRWRLRCCCCRRCRLRMLPP